MTGLGQDKIARLKAKFRAEKEEYRQQMLTCACCADMSVEDILVVGDGQQGGAAHPFWGGEERSEMPDRGGVGSSGRPGSDERPGMGDGGRVRGGSVSRPDNI